MTNKGLRIDTFLLPMNATDLTLSDLGTSPRGYGYKADQDVDNMIARRIYLMPLRCMQLNNSDPIALILVQIDSNRFWRLTSTLHLHRRPLTSQHHLNEAASQIIVKQFASEHLTADLEVRQLISSLLPDNQFLDSSEV